MPDKIGSRDSGPNALISGFLILLPVAAAAGPHLASFDIGVGQLYAFRWLSLIGLPLAVLLRRPLTASDRGVTEPLLIVTCLWLLWGATSLLWTPAPKTGITEIISIALGSGATLIMIFAVGERISGLRLLALGWAAAFLLEGVVAAWELRTGNHLPSSFANARVNGHGGIFVAGTFANPNALGAFLLMAHVVFLWRLVDCRSAAMRLLWLGGVMAAPVMMLLGGCRTALAGTVVCTIIFVWSFGNWRQRVLFSAVAALSSAIAVTVFLRLSGLTLGAVAATWRLTGELQYGGSAGIRINLLRNGWEMIKGTWGMGVGAGGFTHSILHRFGGFNTGGIINPHNYWLEIGSQYGLLIVAGLSLLLAWWVLLLWGILRAGRLCGDRGGRALGAAGLTALAAYAIGAGANSTFIAQPINWAFLGTLCAFIGSGVRRARYGMES